MRSRAKCRVKYPRELLTTTDRTVSEIAAELGFENVSQFSAFFRQREKITATQYRSKYGF